uniref:Uncharacterized protein n=1 Tax=Tetranychus urticae TaxID=32264 RepID=T1JYP0_TETUR
MHGPKIDVELGYAYLIRLDLKPSLLLT